MIRPEPGTANRSRFRVLTSQFVFRFGSVFGKFWGRSLGRSEAGTVAEAVERRQGLLLLAGEAIDRVTCLLQWGWSAFSNKGLAALKLHLCPPRSRLLRKT